MNKNQFFGHLTLKNKNKGYCPVCERKTLFIENGPWLRDNYLCVKCNSIPRERALVHAINTFIPGWTDMKVHESSPGTVNSTYISKKCKDYSYSHYFPDTECGSYENGVRCENLEKLTFDDGSMDISITQDVFEHIIDPHKAFREIGRVLRPGGLHVFTVPMHKEFEKSRPGIKLENGNIINMMEPVYHGNLIDLDGSMVTWDHGRWTLPNSSTRARASIQPPIISTIDDWGLTGSSSRRSSRGNNLIAVVYSKEHGLNLYEAG